MTQPVVEQQQQKAFWDPTPQRQHPELPARPTDGAIKGYLDSPDCPINNIIVGPANEGNLKILRTFAFTALQRFNHSCRGLSFGLYGSAGQGKTYVCKQWAKTMGIPFIFIQSSALADTWMLFQKISDEFARFGFKIVPYQQENNFVIPPCIVAFDEAHRLKASLMKGGLLNPMEYTDATMLCKPPGFKSESITVNCKHICWVVMTTDVGLLEPAFESRLEHIAWAPAGPQELRKIVSFQMQKEFEAGDVKLPFPEEATEYVVKYASIPRTCLAFARKMVMERVMNGGTWQAVAKAVADNQGIDQWGLTKKQVAVITALGQRPIAKGHLTTVAQCQLEELERYVLPPLQAYINGGPIIVPISGKGMALTRAGLLELEKRGLPHKGEKVTAEYLEMRRAS